MRVGICQRTKPTMPWAEIEFDDGWTKLCFVVGSILIWGTLLWMHFSGDSKFGNVLVGLGVILYFVGWCRRSNKS